MAKKVITTTEYIDDLDGGKAEGTVSFAVDGKSYEIDLSKKNRTAFDKVLKPYIDAGRTVRGARPGTTSTKTAKASRAARGEKRSDLAEIRAWAHANGYAVSDRGRISAALIEAFDVR